MIPAVLLAAIIPLLVAFYFLFHLSESSTVPAN